MIWNTIAHPRMMDDTSGTSNEPAAFDNVVFSKELLEPPIKHMNRDYLATLDYVVWNCRAGYDVPKENQFSKTTLLIGDFETLFAAGQNKAFVNGFTVFTDVGIRQNPDTGVAEYYPIEEEFTKYYVRITQPRMPKCFYGKMTIDEDTPEKKILDFGKDRFVLIPNDYILISPSGEVLFDNDEVLAKLMEYAVDEESSAG